MYDFIIMRGFFHHPHANGIKLETKECMNISTYTEIGHNFHIIGIILRLFYNFRRIAYISTREKTIEK